MVPPNDHGTNDGVTGKFDRELCLSHSIPGGSCGLLQQLQRRQRCVGSRAARKGCRECSPRGKPQVQSVPVPQPLPSQPHKSVRGCIADLADVRRQDRLVHEVGLTGCVDCC